MKIKNLWLLTGILLLAHLFLQFKFVNTFDTTTESWLLDVFSVIFSSITLPFISGILLALLIALIPFKKNIYKDKLRIAFPLFTSVILVLIISSYVILIIDGTLHPIDYANIKTNKNVNCSEVKEGIFTCENLLIERFEGKQIQTNLETNERTEYKIQWKSDCEYHLIPINNITETIRVKISDVSVEKYDCYVTTEKYARKYTMIRKKTSANRGLAQ